MELIKFILFFIVSYLLLMRIFVYSTYHKYFWKIFPALAIYSGTVGYLLTYFGLHSGFLWQIFLSITSFVWNQRKQDQKFDELINTIDDKETIKLLVRSARNTKKYFWMSAATYLIVFSITYVYSIYKN